MIILATIPVGLVGLVADKPFREIFGRPIVAGVFLIINGVILYCGEKFRPRSSVRADQEIAAQREEALVSAGARRPPGPPAPGMARQARHASGQQAVRQEELVQAIQADERLAGMGWMRALIIGASQILALLAGISRDGVTMVAGMNRGLSREDAARFAFLLATPVILAAGVLELPKLTGPDGQGIHGQILVGSILSGVGAYLSVRFLMRYFQTRTLTPFAIYCFVFGLLSVIYLGAINSRRAGAGAAADGQAGLAAVAGEGPAEGVEDDGEPDFELVAEVVAGPEDVLGRDLGQVGVLAGELLHERFGGLGDGLRAEGQSGLLERESVDVAVQQGVGVGGHGHGEARGAQGAEGRIVVAQRRRAGIGS